MIDFIGLGAQKAGTSWIYACLYEHPQICCPFKELHYFSRDRYQKGRAWYEEHYAKCPPGTLRGEFSTSYLYSPEAAGRIFEQYPEAKLLAVVRNPVERAYSHYRNAIKNGEIDGRLAFPAYCEAEPSVIGQGLYGEQLRRYRDLFAPDQLLVMVYEDSLRDAADYIRRIYRFLGVDPDFVPAMLHDRVNVARRPRSVGMEKAMQRVAETLRGGGLDRLVWMVRRSGLPDFVRRFNTRASSAGSGDGGGGNGRGEQDALRGCFVADAEELAGMLGRDMIAEWNLQ